MQYVLLIVLLGLTWGLVLLPQQRKVKAHRAFVAGLSVGDEVVTTAGVFGTVTALESDRLRLRIAPEVEVTIARLAIGRLQSDLDDHSDSHRSTAQPSDVDDHTEYPNAP